MKKKLPVCSAATVARLQEIRNTNQEASSLWVLDTQQFTDLLSISKRTALNWRNKGVIPYSELGGKIYYKYSDIMKIMEQQLRKK